MLSSILPVTVVPFILTVTFDGSIKLFSLERLTFITTSSPIYTFSGASTDIWVSKDRMLVASVLPSLSMNMSTPVYTAVSILFSLADMDVLVIVAIPSITFASPIISVPSYNTTLPSFTVNPSLVDFTSTFATKLFTLLLVTVGVTVVGILLIVNVVLTLSISLYTALSGFVNVAVTVTSFALLLFV